MKVSVVIPVYNVKPYLERCVQSVLHQSFKDLEIILVDDGSTDGSGEMCDQTAKRDSRIVVIHQKNQGLSGARNTGIKKAKGEYIVFLDSDDEWLHPDGLELLLQGDMADLIVFKRVDIKEGDLYITSADYELNAIKRLHDTQDIFTYMVKSQMLQISACFLLIRRQILIDNNIYFPCGIISEDVFWTMHLWQHVTSARFTNLDLYGYHHREGSIKKKTSIRVFQSYNFIFTYWKNQCAAGCKNAETILAYMANMWVSRGYDFLHLAKSDKQEAINILKKHTDLLNWGFSPKSKRTKKPIKLLGVKTTVIILGLYWHMRSHIIH